MKLMTYNILNDGNERLPVIIEIVKKESPDYLTINEANIFAKDDNKILKKVAQKTGFPFFDIALSGEYDYHVAVFSKYPFKKITKIQPLKRACLIAAIEKILNVGYCDCALQMDKNKESTAPTSINEYEAHSNMRLDYIFLSKSLLHHLKEYNVIKNNLTEKVSDHYPVKIVLE